MQLFREIISKSHAIAAVLCILACTAAAQDPTIESEDVAEIIGLGTDAMRLKHVAPKYPSSARLRGLEGWVILNFSVNQAGKTEGITVADASIPGYFEQAAVKALQGWEYQPAMVGDRPTIESNKLARFSFSMKKDSVGATTRKFKNSYDKISKVLNFGDNAKARKLLDELKSRPKRLLAEVCYIDLLESSYWESEGDAVAALRYLERVLVIADTTLAEPAYYSVLRKSMINNAKAHNYVRALKRYNKLVKVDAKLTSDDPLHEVAKRIREAIASDNPIVREGVLANCMYCQLDVPSWQQSLNRTRFSIESLSGELSKVDILCGHHSTSVKYNAETRWDIEKGWGNCDVRVFGEDGATFRFVEHQEG